MNVFIKAKKELYKIIKSVNPNIRPNIYFINKFADISLYIPNLEILEMNNLSIVIKDYLIEIGLIVKIIISGCYINIYIDDGSYIESLKDDEQLIEIDFKINLISDNNYISNLIADVYDNFYANFDCQIPKNHDFIIDKDDRNIIISCNYSRRLYNVNHIIYDKIDENNIDYKLFKFIIFSSNIKKNIYFDFEKLKEICYNNNLFLIYYIYNHSNRIIKYCDIYDRNDISSKEIELLKMLNYFYIVKEDSIKNLTIDLMMSYLFKICIIYLNLYNLSDLNINIIRIKIIKKVNHLITSIMKLLNIELPYAT